LRPIRSFIPTSSTKKNTKRRYNDDAFRRLKAKGARFVLVFNHDSHRDARPFYRRMGFGGIGNFKGFYRKL